MDPTGEISKTRKNVVICLNMQINYFSSKGSACNIGKYKVVRDNVKQCLKDLGKDVYDIIYTRDIRSPEDDFHGHQPTQCMVGTLDVNMVEGLPKSSNILIPTSRPSALFKTPIRNLLVRNDPTSVYLVGAETNSAVLFTASDLRNLGYNVKVVEPMTIARDDYAHNNAISLMADVLGVEIVDKI